jgi:hypothetical protein
VLYVFSDCTRYSYQLHLLSLSGILSFGSANS